MRDVQGEILPSRERSAPTNSVGLYLCRRSARPLPRPFPPCGEKCASFRQPLRVEDFFVVRSQVERRNSVHAQVIDLLAGIYVANATATSSSPPCRMSCSQRSPARTKSFRNRCVVNIGEPLRAGNRISFGEPENHLGLIPWQYSVKSLIAGIPFPARSGFTDIHHTTILKLLVLAGERLRTTHAAGRGDEVAVAVRDVDSARRSITCACTLFRRQPDSGQQRNLLLEAACRKARAFSPHGGKGRGKRTSRSSAKIQGPQNL